MAAAAAAAKCGVRGQYMSNHLGDKPRYPTRYSLACTCTFSILKFVLFVVSLPEPTLRTFLSSTFNYLGYFGLFFLVQVTFNMLSSTEKDVNVNVKLQSNYKLLS